MACAELERLRQQASELKKRLGEQRRKVRGFRGSASAGQPQAHSDYEAFLERKLLKAAAQIERHIAQHRCGE